MQNITYYLGAGASANSLPLYSDFQLRLSVFRDFIYHYQRQKDNSFKEKATLYINSLDKLITLLNATETTTLDVLASELYRQRHSSIGFNFSKLKYLVSDFFVFEQLEKEFNHYKTQSPDSEGWDGYGVYSMSELKKINTSIDNRYRGFINSETNGDLFPPNINFVSWNYDIQMELAYSRMKHSTSLYFSQKELQVFPSPAVFDEIDTKKSRIIKLNGTAGIYYSDNQRNKIENSIDQSKVFANSYIDFMIDIFHNNYNRITGGYPFFTFSFEEDTRNKNNLAISYANEILKQTNTLVIIGYSFHPANRNIDRQVFENSINLKKVYIQAPSDSDFKRIKFNFSKIRPDITDIEHYDFVNEFLSSNNV